ncbi:MAG: TonB-dependent receptor, partial [Bryobacteraceae bacterium]|nr:TonB-dependent receptor [Bryobacteraceae bacterium]
LPGNSFGYNLSIPQTDNQGVAKFDQMIGDKHRFSLRYFFDDYFRLNNDGLLDFNSQFNWATHNATINDTHTFSPNVTNVATITFNRNTFIRSPLSTPAGASSWAELGCRSCPQLAPAGVPEHWNVAINNGFNVRSSTAFFSYMQNWQGIDNLSIVKDQHLISVGGEISRSRRNGREFFNAAPVFTFNGQRSGASGYGYADFFLGVPVSVQQNTPLRSYPVKWTPFLYIQDDWKVRRRFTLNLGLRWAPYVPVTELRDEFAAFRPGQQSTVYPLAPQGMVFVGDEGVGRGITNAGYNKLEPRFGFAWDLFGDGKTSVRGGYGVFFDTLRLVSINNFSTRQPFTLGLTTNDPASLTDPYQNHPGNLQALLSFDNSSTANRAQRRFVRRVQMNSIDPDFTTGYMQQWNLSIQRELFPSFVVTAAYVGSKGTHFQMTQELNPATYIPGQSTAGNIDQRRIYGDYERIQNLQASAFSTYNSLQVSFRQRFSGGLSLLGSYVWSKFIDLASNDGNGGTAAQGTNPFNWLSDKGLSDFDVPHRVVTSFIWELPFLNSGRGLRRTLLGGWQLNGIVTLQSGQPFSVAAGENRSLAGGAGDRADLLYTPAVYSDKSRGEQVSKYFETEAFGQPALGTFGTSGRNILRGPGLANVDAALFKDFRVAEGKRFELRWEVFNTLNRPNFFNPVASRTNLAVGRLTAARDPRIMQFGAKFVF